MDSPKEIKPVALATRKYICIRKCFSQGRLWLPMIDSTSERDYVLVTDKLVSSKNFMEVKEVPKLKSDPVIANTLYEIQNNIKHSSTIKRPDDEEIFS